MNREKLAWSASAALLAVLAFQIPGSLAQRDDDYAFVRTLVDVHRRVVDNYVDPVDEGKLNDGAITGMLAQLDPYTDYVPPAQRDEFDRMLTGNFTGVGIRLDRGPDGSFVIVTPVDGSPAADSGIEPGDVIRAVDGRAVDARLGLPDLIKRIGGPKGTPVTLTVRHPGGAEATIRLTRTEVHTPTVKGFRRRPDNRWDYWVSDAPKVGYVRLTQFTGSSYAELRAAVEQMLAGGLRGLVLDLRFNPGGELTQAESIINMLVPAGRTMLTTRGRARPERRDVSTGHDDDGRPTLRPFPLVVLVNEHSASAAEIVSGSLMDNGRAIVMGTRTFGKGSVQEVMPIDVGHGDGGELKLTVAYYYLPSGRLVHRRKDAADWGVEPQIAVPMDEAAQDRVVRAEDAAEVFRRPSTGPSTEPKTDPKTDPTTQPGGDPQLQAAVNTLLGVIVLDTQPATRP